MTRKAKTFALITVAGVLLLFVGLFARRYLKDSSTVSPQKWVIINIRASRTPGGKDRITFGEGRAVSLESLGAELSRLKRDKPDLEPIIGTERNTSFTTFNNVMSEVRRAGIEHMSTYIIPSPTPLAQAPIS